jgi:hypothetical protein
MVGPSPHPGFLRAAIVEAGAVGSAHYYPSWPAALFRPHQLILPMNLFPVADSRHQYN